MDSLCIYQVIGSVDYEFECSYYTASTYDKALEWFKANVDGNKDFAYHDSFVITKVLVDSTIINEEEEFENMGRDGGYKWRVPLDG